MGKLYAPYLASMDLSRVLAAEGVKESLEVARLLHYLVCYARIAHTYNVTKFCQRHG